MTTGTSSALSVGATNTAGDDDASATANQTPPGTDTAQQDEEYWQQRITTAREGRRRGELLVAALQNRVDGLWADFTQPGMTRYNGPRSNRTVWMQSLNSSTHAARSTATSKRSPKFRKKRAARGLRPAGSDSLCGLFPLLDSSA